MVLTGLKLSAQELVARFGFDKARRFDAASIEAIDFVERLVRDEHIDCEFARCGHLALASKPSHYADFEREAQLVREKFGRSVGLVSRKDLEEEIGSTAYFGALCDESSAAVNPAKLVQGLADAARRAGASLVENMPVRRIERQGSGSSSYMIHADHGSTLAEHVLVATGAYTGAESPWLRRRIVPIGSYVIVTESLPEALAREIAPRNRMMYDSKRFLHYFRLTSDRRMLFGGRASFVPESAPANAQSAEVLRRDMAMLFPQLQDARIDYAWGGTIDFTADMLPHAGEIGGIHYVAGFAGHGVALATLVGAQLAAKIAGDDDVESPFIKNSFPVPALGAHRVFPGLVSAAGAWYRLLDLMS